MLPSNFTQLEYIESSGTQYVDTNFKPNQNTKLEIKVQTTQTTGGGIAVCDTAWQSNGFGVWVNAAGYGNATTQNVAFYGEEPIAAILDRNTLYKDGELVWTATESTFQTSFNLALMALNRNGSPQEKVTGKIYCCKIWDNGTLIRNFIPCKNDAGEVGLWDDVNREFYGNAGTGTFATGPVVPQEMAESDIVELEYIQSDGDAYINSGVYPNQNMRVLADMEVVKFDGYAPLFGARVASKNNEYATWAISGTSFQDGFGTSMESGLSANALERNIIDKNKNLFSVNETLLKTHTNQSFSAGYSLFVFNINTAGNTTGSFKTFAKLYFFIIYDNGTLVRDFIPAKTVADEVGLYDKVFKQFYRNAGTGTFTAGPEASRIPNAPEQLYAMSKSDTEVVLSWETVEKATGYRVYEGGVLLSDQVETSFSDKVTPFVGENYAVTAYNENGESGPTSLYVYTTPENPILFLVTDRTQMDVSLRNDKGTYQASDLRRVTYAMDYLGKILRAQGYICPVYPKMKWEDTDWPTPSSMEQYLSDLKILRSCLTLPGNAPDVPPQIGESVPGAKDGLNYSRANDIEQILVYVDQMISKILLSWYYANEIYCGEV